MPGRWRCGCGSVPRARRPTADRVRRGGARRPPPGRAGRFRYAAPRRPWGSRRRTHRRRIRNPPARRCARRTRRPRWPARPGHGRGFAPRSRRWRSGSPGRRASAYRKGWCRTVARRRATGRRGASSGGAAASGSPRATAPGIRRRSVPARCGCVAAGYWRSARPLAWPRGRAVQHRYAEDHVVVLVDPRQVQRHGGGEEQEGRFATIADRIEQCAFQRQPVARGAAQPGRALRVKRAGSRPSRASAK